MTKTSDKVAFMSTDVISKMVTKHAQNVGMLGPNEEFHVTFADVVDDVTTLEGYVEEETVN